MFVGVTNQHSTTPFNDITNVQDNTLSQSTTPNVTTRQCDIAADTRRRGRVEQLNPHNQEIRTFLFMKHRLKWLNGIFFRIFI